MNQLLEAIEETREMIRKTRTGHRFICEDTGCAYTAEMLEAEETRLRGMLKRYS